MTFFGAGRDIAAGPSRVPADSVPDRNGAADACPEGTSRFCGERKPIDRYEPPGDNVRFIACGGTFVGLVLIAVFLGDPLAAALPLIFLIVLGLAAAYLLIVKRRFSWEGERRIASCLRGQAVDLGIRFTNGSRLPLVCAELVYSISDPLGREQLYSALFSLPAKGACDFDFMIPSDHIGIGTACVHRVILYDYLGLFNSIMDDGRLFQVDVEPRLHDGRGRFSDGLCFGGMPGFSDGAYDDLRSALLDQMPDCTEIVVVIDGGCPDCPPDDQMALYDSLVEGVLSLGVQAHANGIGCRFSYFGRDGAIHRISASDASRTRSELAAGLRRLVPGSRLGQTASLLFAEAARTAPGQVLVVCSARVDEGLADELAILRQNRRCQIAVAEVVSAPFGTGAVRSGEGLRGTGSMRLEAAGIIRFVLAGAPQPTVQVARESEPLAMVPLVDRAMESAADRLSGPASGKQAGTGKRVGRKAGGAGQRVVLIALSSVIAVLAGVAITSAALAIGQAGGVPWFAWVILAVAVVVAIVLPFILRYRERQRFYLRAVELPVREYVATMYNFFLSRFELMGMAHTDVLTPYEFADVHEWDLWGFSSHDSQANFPYLSMTYVKARYSGEPLDQDELAAYHGFYQSFYRNCRAYLGIVGYLKLYFAL